MEKEIELDIEMFNRELEVHAIFETGGTEEIAYDDRSESCTVCPQAWVQKIIFKGRDIINLLSPSTKLEIEEEIVYKLRD